MKESETEKENPPSTISKLSNISNTENTSLNSNDLRLSCPNCDLIPALFFDFNSKNIYQISAACENKHLITNMPVKEYYDKCMKSKNSKDTFNDFICFKHNANFNSFCKTCRKNICKECSDSEHKNHFISQFYELLPSNEEIIQLKNSIDNEINDVNVFLIETFNNWIKEIKSKFDILIENIKAKNKLYNFIINFYETKEFNYQNIYNIKIISQNQLKRNPLTQEIQTLKNIITRNEALLNSKNKNKDEYEESKNKYLKLKSSQLLKILNILNSDVNSNYKFTPYDSAEKTLENFLEDKNDSSSVLSEYVVINPYNKSYNDISTNNINESINSEKNSDSKLKESLTINEKLELANEIKLTKRKLNQNISQESIVHCLVVLKDYKGKLTNRFAVGLENGNINIYYLDSKTNNIFLDFEIKEHTKAVNYITCLHDGRLLTCSYDNTMKVIEETISYSYLLSFWKRYYVIQTLTKPIIDKYVFQPVSVVEMSNNTLVSGDWKNITIWKLIKKEEKRHKKREKINFSFDILDYNRNKYNYYYEIYKEINISTSVSSLLNIDNKTFISAHYGPGIVTFYNIYDESKKSIEKIKCVDSATQCMTLIEVKKAESNWQKDKIIIVGGYKCIYLLSAKDQDIIDKMTLPGNDYIKCLINSGMTNISNGFICGGLFNQYTFDLVHYNTKSHFGFNELVVNEVSRIKDTSKGAINSIIYIKKNLSDESFNQKNIIIVTGGNEQTIKTFTGIEDDEEED